MSRTITLIAAVGAAVVVASPAWGKGQPVEPQWKQALDARSEGLNRMYGLGEYSPEMRALRLRSEALNQKYGLGAYAKSTFSAIDERERALVEKGNVQPSTGTPPDAFERTVSAGRSEQWNAYPASTVRIMDARENVTSAGDELTAMLNAREQAFIEKRNVQLSSGTPPDAFERAVDTRGTSTLEHFNANDNRFRVTPVTDPVEVAAKGSGDEIEWPQIGIGFGVGIALALGLLLGLRATRHQTLAH
jgi:hypothetical protein